MKNLGKQQGFTIVELLIVVVVIAILAAITIVAYNGVTQRAQLVSVQSDVNGAIKKLESYKQLTGAYPSAVDADIALAGVKINKGNYSTDAANVLYCANNTTQRVGFAVTAKNGTTYAQSTTLPFGVYTLNYIANYVDLCTHLTGASGVARYGYVSGWRSWVNP